MSNTDSCNTVWCIYVPQGTYGVAGSTVGQVYMYKSSSRPAGPPYSNSALVGGFPLDSSNIYGIGWPKTIPVTAKNSSGIGGTVEWNGGLGHGSLPLGCSSYRLQIPFKLRREESSSSSSTSSTSSESSNSLCDLVFTNCDTTTPYLSCGILRPFNNEPKPIEFFTTVSKYIMPDCILKLSFVVGYYLNQNVPLTISAYTTDGTVLGSWSGNIFSNSNDGQIHLSAKTITLQNNGLAVCKLAFSTSSANISYGVSGVLTLYP